MITLKKSDSKDFVILNITDMQMNPSDWNEGDKAGQSVVHTISTLVDRVKPDLITVTGDIANGYAEFENSDPYNSIWNSVYRNFTDFMDSFRIPWAPVSGNHDHFFKCISYFEESEYCLFDMGDEFLGRGNYVIGIQDREGKIIHGIFMLDTHANFSCHKVFGEEEHMYCSLWPSQLEWYDSKITELEKLGCENSSMFMHIPIYAYRDAKSAALKDGVDSEKVSVSESYCGDCWKDEYRDSFGVWHEGICSAGTDDGVFAKLTQRGHTSHVVAGHDHIDNAVVKYEGICLIYGLKTGLTTYFEADLNGGTVLSMGSDGKIKEVRHEYVK